MAIQLLCPHCNRQMEADDAEAGRTGPCDSCGALIGIPSSAGRVSDKKQIPEKDAAPAGRNIGGLLVCGLLLLSLGAVLFPVIGTARENARRNTCNNQLAMIGVGVQGIEAATGRFPMATDSEFGLAAPPGSRKAGYSWLVKVLPYMEERYLPDHPIWQATQEYSLPAFDARLAFKDGTHFCSVPLPFFCCPSYMGSSVNSDQSDYQHPVTLGNYFAFVGAGPGLTSEKLQLNGVLTARNSSETEGGQEQGIRVRAIADGTRYTLMACESREEVYASWYDGQTSWVLPLRVGTEVIVNKLDGRPGLAEAAQHTIQFGPAGGNGNIAMPRSGFWGISGAKSDRAWGPSSQHGSVVMHLYADGHTQVISAEISANLYYRLITRAGGETPPSGDCSI